MCSGSLRRNLRKEKRYVEKKLMCAAPFVEHFIILCDKIILNQGVCMKRSNDIRYQVISLEY